MLVIRLSRIGKKNHPTFRLIISEKSKDLYGDYLELLGNYDPHTNQVNLKADRIKYWLSKGAQPSGTVHNLLVDKKIIAGQKIKVANIKMKKEEKKSATEGTEKKEAKEKAEARVEKPKEKEKPEVKDKKTSITEKKELPKAQKPS